MAYKYPVSKCEQCGEKLKVDENSGIDEQEDGKVIGYCPNCLVSYEMVEV